MYKTLIYQTLWKYKPSLLEKIYFTLTLTLSQILMSDFTLSEKQSLLSIRLKSNLDILGEVETRSFPMWRTGMCRLKARVASQIKAIQIPPRRYKISPFNATRMENEWFSTCSLFTNMSVLLSFSLIKDINVIRWNLLNGYPAEVELLEHPRVEFQCTEFRLVLSSKFQLNILIDKAKNAAYLLP